MKRQEGIESRHGWKDAMTISDNIQHKVACGEKCIWKSHTKIVCPKFLGKKKKCI